jgi:hypothetical protein
MQGFKSPGHAQRFLAAYSLIAQHFRLCELLCTGSAKHARGNLRFFADKFRKIGSNPNGMKLACEFLLYQLLTQCLPGFEHQGEALGAPLLDARLYPMRADGVGDYGP